MFINTNPAPAYCLRLAAWVTVRIFVHVINVTNSKIANGNTL